MKRNETNNNNNKAVALEQYKRATAKTAEVRNAIVAEMDKENGTAYNCNGATGYNDGETIDAYGEVLRCVLTVCNALVHITRVKADRSNKAVALYLERVEAVIKQLRYNARIRNGGIEYGEQFITAYGVNTSDILSDINGGYIAIMLHHGEKMSVEVFKDLYKDFAKRITIDGEHKDALTQFLPSLDEMADKYGDKVRYTTAFFDSVGNIDDLSDGLKTAIFTATSDGKLSPVDIEIVERLSVGISYGDIADLLEMPKPTIYKRAKRAFAVIREYMTVTA